MARGIGYDIFDFDATGMLVVERIDLDNIFESDEAAVEQAIKDGFKIIPVDELPENFERRYLGWIDTPENRKAIEEYCSREKQESMTEREKRYVLGADK